jgi:type VI secretion system protein ImpM
MFPSVASIGLVGKAPAQADFMRIDAADASAQELLSWLEQSDDALRRTGAALPPTPTAFVFSGPSLRNTLVGVLAPSRDHVGRSFPLAVFAVLPAAALSDHYRLVPAAFRNFLGASGSLLQEAPSLSAAQIAERVRALPRTGESEWRSADDERRALLEQPSASWLTELTELGGPLGPHYALRTFVAACRDRAAEPPKSAIVLACPLGAAGPMPWLELAARILRWKGQAPALLWNEAAPPRLLLTLGASPGSSLSYLARPDSNAPSLWSLTTAHPPSQQAARDGLGADQRAAIEEKRGATGQLLDSLAR